MKSISEAQIDELIELLTPVAKKEGAYNMLPLTHAENVINSASDRAKKAIEILKGLT